MEEEILKNALEDLGLQEDEIERELENYDYERENDDE